MTDIQGAFETITVAQAVQLDQGLAELKHEKLPIHISLRIVKLSRFVAPIVTKFNFFREKQAQRLGTQVENHPNQYTFNQPEHRKEFEEVVTRESERQIVLPDNLKIKFAELQSLKIAPSTLFSLTPVLIEDEEHEVKAE